MPSASESERPRRIVVDPDGPLLVEGPVEVVGADGTVSRSDRFMVAVCTCRRTRTAPWCDTSHRCHERAARAPHTGRDRPRDPAPSGKGPRSADGQSGSPDEESASPDAGSDEGSKPR